MVRVCCFYFFSACLNIQDVKVLIRRGIFLFFFKTLSKAVARLTQEPEVLSSIPGPATYFRVSFR